MIKLLKNKSVNLPKGAKASIAFFLSSLVTKGIVYITTPLYTRMLTSIEYGKVSVFMTWLEIFGIIAMFCLSYGVFNNGMLDYPDQRNEYSFSILMLSNVITIVFAILLFASYYFWGNWINLDLKYYVLMIVIFLTQPAYNFWVAKQRYEYRYKGVIFWSLINAVFSSLIPVLLLCYTNINHLISRIFGAQIFLCFVYTGFYIYLGIKSRWKINKSFWNKILLFNLPLIPHYLSTYLLGSSDKLMISYMKGDDYTAYYSVAYSVASIAIIVWHAINSSLIPYTYESCQKKEYDKINKVTIPLLLIFAGACSLVILMAPEAVKIISTEEYLDAIYVIPPIVGGVFFQVQYYVYSNIVYYYKKPKYVMAASVTATLTNLILNYIAIPRFGYKAAGYTTLICYMIQAIIDYFAMRKVISIKIYNMKFIIKLSLVVMIIASASNVLYDFTVPRYIIVAALFIIAILYKNKIIIMIQNMRNKEK